MFVLQKSPYSVVSSECLVYMLTKWCSCVLTVHLAWTEAVLAPYFYVKWIRTDAVRDYCVKWEKLSGLNVIWPWPLPYSADMSLCKLHLTAFWMAFEEAGKSCFLGMALWLCIEERYVRAAKNSSSRGPEAASLRQLSEFIADGSWDQDHLLVPLVCPHLLWCIFFVSLMVVNLLNSQAPASPASWVLMLRSAVLKQNHRWILTDEKQFAVWVNHLKKWLNKYTHRLYSEI